MLRFYGLAERHGRFLTPQQGVQMHDAAMNFALKYKALVRHAVKRLDGFSF